MMLQIRGFLRKRPPSTEDLDFRISRASWALWARANEAEKTVKAKKVGNSQTWKKKACTALLQ